MTTAIPAEAFKHGDYRRYWRGCRCQPCAAGATKRSARNQLLRIQGTPSVCSPRKAAAHVHALRVAGMTNDQVMEAAGISNGTLHRILHGRPIRREVSIRVLATPVPAAPATGTKALRSPVGTCRRLQALAVAGWPASVLAERLGVTKQRVSRLMRQNEQHVSLATELKVRRLFGDLLAVSPESVGVNPVSAKRARLAASRHNWHPAGVWDDIDNPDETPKYGDRTTRREAIVEDVAELARLGYPRDVIAERVGATWEYVITAHARQGTPLPRIAA